MLVDRAQDRLYATHGGTKTLSVLDLKSGTIRQATSRASQWMPGTARCLPEAGIRKSSSS